MTAATATRLVRHRGGRVLAGVAAGLAEHLDLPVLVVRIGFVLLSLAGGLGLILYAAYWAVLPVDDRPGGRDMRQLVPFAALVLGLGLLSVNLSGPPRATAGWLAAVVTLGVGVIWHQAGPRVRERWAGPQQGPVASSAPAAWARAVVGAERHALVARLFGGGLLVIVGVIGLISYFVAPLSTAGFGAMINGVIFAVLGLGGVGLVLMPVLVRVFTQLRAEREGRVREQERAELAAMVHDELLHTLALIQRSADDHREVLRLARGQERSLRNWLYRPTGSPAKRFAAAVEQTAADVENAYSVAVEAVVVGDRETDERVGALVAAAREALVNAARHAAVSTVSLYAEVEDDRTSVYVRDRGVGFDPGAVVDGRHGVRGSILGRMRRHGGTAEIRSEPGVGTEVRLVMPHAASASGDAGDGGGRPR